MFTSIWFLWLIVIAVWLGSITYFLFKRSGIYDFITPMIGVAIFFIGLAFGIGYLVGS